MKKRSAVGSLAIVLLAGWLTGCSAPSAPDPGSTQSTSSQDTRSTFSQELHDALPQSVQSAGTISVVGEQNPPWRVFGADGSLSGVQADVLSELGTILGVKFILDRASGLAAVKLAVQSGRNDAAFGPLISNTASQQDLTFIEYVLGQIAFSYEVGHKEPASLLDLCGSTIAVLEGTTGFDALLNATDERCRASGQQPVVRLSQPDQTATIVAITSGRADYSASTAFGAVGVQRQNPGKFKAYVTTAAEYTPDHLGMAFDKSKADLAAAVFGAWKVLYENGAYGEIMDKYGLSAMKTEVPVLSGSNP